MKAVKALQTNPSDLVRHVRLGSDVHRHAASWHRNE